MATYDSPAEGLSRQHEDLPRPRMTKTRLGLLPEAERTGEEPDPMKIFQEFLQASIDATTSQQQLVKEERKVEKTAKSWQLSIRRLGLPGKPITRVTNKVTARITWWK